MRIRKNAKLSSLIFSHASAADPVHTHVCHLNQSPWDVIPFSQETSYPSLNQQFEGEDSFIANGSFSDSIGAVESVASMMELDDKVAIMKGNEMFIKNDNNEMPKVSRVFVDDEDNNNNEMMKIDKEFGVLRGGKLLCCNKSDGKNWQCKNVPKYGHSLCDHHLTLLKSHNNNNNNSVFNSNPSIKKQEKSIVSRRGRARVTKKGSSSTSNPYEFYYYSGFGPLWGKRRGDKGSDGSKSESKDLENGTSDNYTGGSVIQNNNKTPTPSSSSQIDNNNEEFDCVDDDIEDDDDDEDDEENSDNGKKRMRKPVKARSLKSLM